MFAFMKLLGLEIKKFEEEKKSVGEIGETGTDIWHGFISEEFNSELQGREGIVKYDKMYKTDATIAALLRAIKLPILRANWYVEKQDEEAQGEEHAALIDECLFERMNFDEQLWNILLYLNYGVMAFEKVYVRDGDRILLEKLAYRAPSSYYRWELDNNTFGLVQTLPTPRGNVYQPQIPGEKLLIFWNEKEGENYWGVSILRSVYKHWFMKDTLYRLDMIASERWAVGFPVLTLPRNASSQDFEDAKELVKNIRGHQQGYAVLPNPDFKLDILGGGNQANTRDIQPSLMHHDRQIAKSVLAQVIEMGQETGTQALGKTMLDFFTLGIEAYAKKVQAGMNVLIRELIDLNFEGVKKYPTLEFNGIGDIDVVTLTTALEKMVNIAAIVPDAGLEEYLRELMELPKKPEKKTAEVPEQKPEEQKIVTEKLPDIKEEEEKKIEEITKSVIQAKEPKFFRALTFAEKKVDWSTYQDLMNETQETLNEMLTEYYTNESQVFIQRALAAIEKKDVQALNRIRDKSFPYTQTFANTIIEVLTALNLKVQGLTEKEFQKPVKLIDWKKLALKMKVEADIDAELRDLELEGKLTLGSALTRGASANEVRAQLENALSAMIGEDVSITASMFTNYEVNQARAEVFERNREEVYALQYSALLDEVVCDTCLSLDGRIFDKNDDAVASLTPPIHNNCRCILVQILTKEADIVKEAQDRWDQTPSNLRSGERPKDIKTETIPQSILKNLANPSSTVKNSLDNFKTMKSPMIKKGNTEREALAAARKT